MNGQNTEQQRMEAEAALLNIVLKDRQYVDACKRHGLTGDMFTDLHRPFYEAIVWA